MSAFYVDTIGRHATTSTDEIVGKISLAYSKRHVDQKKELTQSWESSVEVIKAFFINSRGTIPGLEQWSILYEYAIPRREKRIDAVLLSHRVIYVIEFKVGQDRYLKVDTRQVEDYCFDLRDFHLESRDRPIIPILLSTEASVEVNKIEDLEDHVKNVQLGNLETLGRIIQNSENKFRDFPASLEGAAWNESGYMPTPTIIEAAQTLYASKSVAAISRNQAGDENLSTTTDAVLNAIREAQEFGTKAICFITGVPGTGKTLAGLNIVHGKEFQTGDKELGIFLSGNSPLVKVLKEALTRDVVKREGINRNQAEHKVGTFIQNVHTFIDEYYGKPDRLPPDRVLIYDEAQRAWTAEHKTRKSNGKIRESEPDILLSVMSRFDGWAAIICLVGGGQEINTGEAGLREWGRTLETRFPDWKVFISPELKEGDHSTGHSTLFASTPTNISLTEVRALHLAVDIRALRTKGLSEAVSALLDLRLADAKRVLRDSLTRYPLFVTRNVETARKWLRSKGKDVSRTGIIASSGGRRLRAIGYDSYHGLRGDSSQQELGAWYLNEPDDVRSSNFLEIVATEYAVQGLELDWAGLLWDADLRLTNGSWEFRQFKGTIWQNVREPQMRQYILNKYRVLLTRAREGLIICVPYGDADDPTRLPKYYDGTFDYIKSLGIPEI